jgi:hypothetical protein
VEIKSESRIHHPRDAVFRAYRDRLSGIIAYNPDIREVQVLSREEEGDIVKLHNVWISDRDIPSIVSKILKPEHLRWDDYAQWNNTGYYCDWTIKTRAFTDSVSCAGRNTFVDDGDSTRVILSGKLDIKLEHIPGVPSFLVRRIAPRLEQFIVSLITPNLERVNASLQRFLDEHG